MTHQPPSNLYCPFATCQIFSSPFATCPKFFAPCILPSHVQHAHSQLNYFFENWAKITNSPKRPEIFDKWLFSTFCKVREIVFYVKDDFGWTCDVLAMIDYFFIFIFCTFWSNCLVARYSILLRWLFSGNIHHLSGPGSWQKFISVEK